MVDAIKNMYEKQGLSQSEIARRLEVDNLTQHDAHSILFPQFHTRNYSQKTLITGLKIIVLTLKYYIVIMLDKLSTILSHIAIHDTWKHSIYINILW